MSKPLVSVNIVTRNRKDELDRAIASAFAQDYRPLEVIVVDNNSDDGSPELVRGKWPEVRLIRLHRNIGCQPGRNIGMANCRGDYIFNLDDDGWLAPDALRLVVDRFEHEQDLFCISGKIIVPDGTTRGWHGPHSGDTEFYTANFAGCASAFRKQDLLEIGYFPEYPRAGAEWNLALRALDKGKKILYYPTVIMFHQPSAIERNRNTFRYWSTKHRLETAFRLDPWEYALFDIPCRSLIDIIRSCRDRTIKGCLCGLGRFLYDLPLLFSQRSPVQIKTIALANYLEFNIVTSPNFAKERIKPSTWGAIKSRILKK